MKYILRMTMKNIAIILVGLILACWSWIYLPKVVHADEITPLEINSATQRANNKELKFDATIDDNRESGIYFKSNNPNEMTFDDDLIILIDDYDFKSQTDIENFVNRNNVAKPILLHWNENHKIDRIEYNQISPYPFADVKGTCNGSDACLLSGSGNTGFFGQACYLEIGQTLAELLIIPGNPVFTLLVEMF